jgi:hypothetical protein
MPLWRFWRGSTVTSVAERANGASGTFLLLPIPYRSPSGRRFMAMK